MNVKKPVIPAVLCALFGTLPAAYAAPSVVNGDFQIGAGNNLDNIADWFDPSNGTFWQGSWQTNNAAITPNATAVVVLGSYESGAVQTSASADADEGNFIYQSIGFADGATSLNVQFDWGVPDDDPGGREVGLSVGVYAYDGAGGFVAADSTDVRGAAGVTLLDSQSFSQTSTGVDGQIGTEVVTFDISGAGTQELFLRFNNYRPADTESWAVVDNVAILGEIPVFVTQPPLFVDGFVGGTVTLTALASSDPAPAYQWEYDDESGGGFVELAGETGASLVLDPAETSHTGYYRVVASNIHGSAVSDETFLDVIYPNPVVVGPDSVVVMPNNDVTLSVSATGLGNLSYQWFKAEAGGDVELEGQTGATLEIANVTAAEAGNYFVVVEDDAAEAEEGFPTETFSPVATVTLVDILVSAAADAPMTDSFDEFYLPGNVDDVDNIDGSPGGVPITASDGNDASTYVAADRTSQGMTFTTGGDPAGYTISSVTVRNVQWNNFLGNGTYYNIQSGDTFEFQFGSVSGGVKTPISGVGLAGYVGSALVNPAANNLGSGQYFTFDLSAFGIGTLSPNTTYYFEIAAGSGDPYFELSGTSVDGYGAGTAFRGETVMTIDGTYVELAGDRAFHVDLTGLGGPAGDYADWIAGYPGVGGLTGFADDADGDGLPNGVENYFGTDPSATNPGVTGVAMAGGTLSFQHPQNAQVASDVIAVYRWSTDLETWHASGGSSGGTEVILSPVVAGGTATVTVHITGPVPARLFTDIEVTQSAP